MLYWSFKSHLFSSIQNPRGIQHQLHSRRKLTEIDRIRTSRACRFWTNDVNGPIFSKIFFNRNRIHIVGCGRFPAHVWLAGLSAIRTQPSVTSPPYNAYYLSIIYALYIISTIWSGTAVGLLPWSLWLLSQIIDRLHIYRKETFILPLRHAVRTCLNIITLDFCTVGQEGVRLHVCYAAL